MPPGGYLLPEKMTMEVNIMEWRKVCSTDHVTEQCIEVATTDDNVLMRSNLRPTETITVTRDELAAFMTAVKAGELDELV